MGHASVLALRLALSVGLAIVVSCAPPPDHPPVLGGGPEEDGDGKGDDAEAEEAESVPPPSCADYLGTCVATSGSCPIQITGVGLCDSTDDEICCTGYGDR
jgi:hypothetical protein